MKHGLVVLSLAIATTPLLNGRTVIGLRIDPSLADLEARTEVVLSELPGFSLVNRGRLKEIADELNLGRVGLTVTETGQLGRKAGADWLIWMQKGEFNRVNWKILEPASGIWISSGEAPLEALDDSFLRDLFSSLSFAGSSGSSNYHLIAIAPLNGPDGKPHPLSPVVESALIRRLSAAPSVRAINRSLYDEMVFERSLLQEGRRLLEAAQLWEGTLTDENGKIRILLGFQSGDEWQSASAEGSAAGLPGVVESLVRTLLADPDAPDLGIPEIPALEERINWLVRAGAYLEGLRLAEILAEIHPGPESDQMLLQVGSKALRQYYRTLNRADWLALTRHLSRLNRHLADAQSGSAILPEGLLAGLPPPTDGFIRWAARWSEQTGYPELTEALFEALGKQFQLTRSYPLTNYQASQFNNAFRTLLTLKTTTVEDWVELILNNGPSLSNVPDDLEEQVHAALTKRLHSENDPVARKIISHSLYASRFSSPEQREEAMRVRINNLAELRNGVIDGTIQNDLFFSTLRDLVERREKDPELARSLPSIRPYLLPILDRLETLDRISQHNWWSELSPGDEQLMAGAVAQLRARADSLTEREHKTLDRFARALSNRYPGLAIGENSGPVVVEMPILTLADLTLGQPFWGSWTYREFLPGTLTEVGYTPGRLWLCDGRMVYEVELPAFRPVHVWTVPEREPGEVRITAFHADTSHLFLFHEERLGLKGGKAWIDRIDLETGQLERIPNSLLDPREQRDRSGRSLTNWLSGTDRAIFESITLDYSARADLDLVAAVNVFDKSSLSWQSLILGSRRPPVSPMDLPGHAFEVRRWTSSGEVWIFANRLSKGPRAYAHAWNPETGQWRKLSAREYYDLRDNRMPLFSESLTKAAKRSTGGRSIQARLDQTHPTASLGLTFDPSHDPKIVPPVRVRGAIRPVQLEEWMSKILSRNASEKDREAIVSKIEQAWLRGRNYRITQIPEGIVVISEQGGYDHIVGFLSHETLRDAGLIPPKE